MYLMLLVTQGGLPIAVLAWQGLSRSKNQLNWLLKTLLVAIVLGVISLAGLWSVFFPWWMPYGLWGIWAVLTIWTFGSTRRQPAWPRRQLGGSAYLAFLGLLVGLLGSFLIQILMGLNPPAIDPVSLSFPLTHGTYQVLNGGNHPLLNAHLKTLEAKYRRYSGQSYGVDLVKLNPFGTRALGLVPKDLSTYQIYGATVLSPCSGRVIAMENQRPEMIPPKPDRENLLGNYVLLRCEAADVLLAHFQPDSVLVQLNDTIQVGQPLGKVGNSGNTNEPHLHIHAQRPGTPEHPIEGEPLPIIFGDRYLVRNNRIQPPAQHPPSVMLKFLL